MPANRSAAGAKPRAPKHGTRFNGVPPAEDMREARRQRRQRVNIEPSKPAGFMSATADPDNGACRALVENMEAAYKLGRHRGRPPNFPQYLAALDALEKAEVPLRDYAGSPAVRILQRDLKLGAGAAQSLLRRLVHLRSSLKTS